MLIGTTEANCKPKSIYERDRIVFYWLVVCAFFIFAMIVLGGVTRLTHSGLSMVEWKPLLGIIPPLSDQQWYETFGKYQQFPEYKIVNQSMTLSEFKSIFYFEYFHRVLGRLIGFIFLIPLLIFWWKGFLTKPMSKNFGVIFILGAAQGLLGWYMVKSGLIDDPRVSHYRLTAHLGLAVLLFGAVIWNALVLFYADRNLSPIHHPRILNIFILLPCLIYLMILSGGFVAGTQAGMIWSTFPLMGDSFIPLNAYNTKPFWMSALSDPTTIQLNHRILAYFIFVASTFGCIFTLKNVSNSMFRKCVITFYVVVCCQVMFGIATLLLFVPVSLAAIHQATAMIVFALSLVTAFIALRAKHS